MSAKSETKTVKAKKSKATPQKAAVKTKTAAAKKVATKSKKPTPKVTAKAAETPKKRGRPKGSKNKVTAKTLKPATATTVTAKAAPKKRGRPKGSKNKVTAETVVKTTPKTISVKSAPKKRGRPKGSKNKSKLSAPRSGQIESVSRLAGALPAAITGTAKKGPKQSVKKTAPVSKKVLAKKKAAAKAITKKKAVKKKTVAKKPAVKKSVAKASVKTAAPTTKTVKAPTVLSKAKPSRTTLASLKSELSELESRLQKSDNVTQRHVQTLKATFAALETHTKKTSSVQKAALTRQVNQLTKKLEAISDDARQSVEAELKSVLSNSDMTDLAGALGRATSRMDEAEAVQAEALRTINLNLAQMARAVEARINEERAARQAAEADTAARIDTIEADTATALTQAGEKIEALSHALKTQQSSDQTDISEKVNELAIQTQAEFDAYKARVDGRMARMEAKASHAEDESKFERLAFQLDRLNARLDTMEHELVTLDERQQQLEIAPAAYAPPAELSAFETPAQMTAPAMMAPAMMAAPSNVVAMTDAFAPQMPAPAPMPVTQSPVADMPAPMPVNEDTAPPRAPHEPVEFVPTAYAPPAPVTAPAAVPTQVAPPPMDAPAQMAPPPMGESGYAVPEINPAMLPADAMMTPQAPQDFEAAPVPLMPYDNPAYAEADAHEMRAERIGGTEAKPAKISKFPISGRNLRMGVAAIALGAIGLYAGKTVLGVGADAPTLESDYAQSLDAADDFNPLESMPIPLDVETAPAIGDYADSRAPDISSDGATTLAAAAEAGNPVAQFQLGIAKLQDGSTDDGVELVRLAANKNLAAAQYRLAKLYESGEGVTTDLTMARKLTQQAAERGNRIAMHDLALYYTDGRGGVDQDVGKAVGWFEQAAERGVVDSQFNLAVLSESGQGMERNVENAYFWYSIAAQQGDQSAKDRISVLGAGLQPAQLSSLDARIKAFSPKPIDEAANGIFRDTPWAKPATGQSVKVTRVRQAQTMLTQLGYDTGGADGSIGPMTRAAITKFERDNALPESGQVTDELLRRLETVAGA